MLPDTYFSAQTTPSPLATLPSTSIGFSPNFFLCYFATSSLKFTNSSAPSLCPSWALTTCFPVSASTCKQVTVASLDVYALTNVAISETTALYSSHLFSDSACVVPLLGAQIGVSNLTQGECGSLGLPSPVEQV